MKLKCDIADDLKFKEYLKKISLNVFDILHPYSFGSEGFCVTCDYYRKKCWLCDQCEPCCKFTEETNEKIECCIEEQKEHFLLELNKCWNFVDCLEKFKYKRASLNQIVSKALSSKQDVSITSSSKFL